jgi:hypothetical protein
MKKLTAKQTNLLNLVKRNSGANTHQLAQARKDRQAYESNLRDRLFTLSRLGLVRSEEKFSPNHASWVIERKWFAVQ